MRTFTAKERQDYYNNLSKKGATMFDKKTGEIVKVSDFARGVFRERAQNIFQKRKEAALYYKNKGNNVKNKKCSNNFKTLKSVPSWLGKNVKSEEMSMSEKKKYDQIVLEVFGQKSTDNELK